MHGCAKYQSQFVITSRDTAEILQPTPRILNLVPVPILLFVETILLFSIASVRNDCFCPLIDGVALTLATVGGRSLVGAGWSHSLSGNLPCRSNTTPSTAIT